MPTNITSTLAARLRTLMEQRGWNQEETARRAHVSRRAVGYLVNYRDPSDRSPTLETVAAIASAFGMPAWRLLGPQVSEAARVAEPEPLDVELLATALAEANDLWRAHNLVPSFDELAAFAARMYSEVQTGIPLRRAAVNVTRQLEQIRSGTLLASPSGSSGEGAKRGQGNQGAAARSKTRTR